MEAALLGYALVSLSMLQCGKRLCFCDSLCLVALIVAAMPFGVNQDMKAATTQRQSTCEGQFEYLSGKALTVQCCCQSMLCSNHQVHSLKSCGESANGVQYHCQLLHHLSWMDTNLLPLPSPSSSQPCQPLDHTAMSSVMSPSVSTQYSVLNRCLMMNT